MVVSVYKRCVDLNLNLPGLSVVCDHDLVLVLDEDEAEAQGSLLCLPSL
jgi:hypothetical protein